MSNIPVAGWQPVLALRSPYLPLYYRIADLAEPAWHTASCGSVAGAMGSLSAAQLALAEIADGCPAAGFRLRAAVGPSELLAVERSVAASGQMAAKVVVEFDLSDIVGDAGVLFSALCSLRRLDVSLVCCGFGLMACSAHDLAALRLAAIQVAEPIIRLADQDARCHRALRSVRQSAANFAPVVIATGLDSSSMLGAALEHGFTFGVGSAVAPATISRPWKLQASAVAAGFGAHLARSMQ